MFEFFYIVFFAVYYIVPRIADSVGSVSLLALEIVYIIALMFVEPRYVIRIIVLFGGLAVLIGLLYALFVDPINVTGNNKELKFFVDYLFMYSCFYFPVLILYRVIKKANRQQVNLFLVICIISALIWSISLLKIISINPLAGRSFGMGQSGIDDDDWIAPFYFVYGIIFVALLCLFFYKYSTKWNQLKIFALFLFLFWAYFIIKAQFTLSLITTILAFLYMRYYFSKLQSSNGMRSIIINIVFVICVILSLDVLVVILPEALSTRMSEFVVLSSGEEMTSESSDMMYRVSLYTDSILAFWESPIIGHRFLNFDGHATGFYVLAQLGLLGGVPIYFGWFKIRKIVMQLMGNVGYAYTPFFVLFLLNIFTNPVHASIPLCFFLNCFIPLSILYYQNDIKIR